MRFIEIELDGDAYRARLNDDAASQTSSALWAALPIEGNAVHTYGSGEMIRILEPLPIRILSLEAETSFQHPGSIIYYPPAKELAICYGSARFAGGLQVTPLAEMEGDLGHFVNTAARLVFTGAKRLALRVAADQTTSFRYPARSGRKIDIGLGGATARATLLESLAPGTCQQFTSALPLEGLAANDIFGGQLTRLWPKPHSLDLRPPPTDRTHRAVVGLWPGYLYWYPEERGLVLCYGDGLYLGGPWPAAIVIPIAAFDGDWTEVRAEALMHFRTGATSFSMRVEEE
jgi:hypothetical protein